MNQLTPAANLLAYSRARAAMTTHPLLKSELPVEHSTSLPVPTLRFGGPGYAWFAGPARRVPQQPLTLSAPDRWWVLDARRTRLTSYNLVAAVPFAATALTGPVTLPVPTRTVQALAADLQLLDQLMDRSVGSFFAGEPADPVVAGDLHAVLTGHIDVAIAAWYEALAPDFFSWLVTR